MACRALISRFWTSAAACADTCPDHEYCLAGQARIASSPLPSRSAEVWAVEAAFREAIQLWADERFEALWEQGDAREPLPDVAAGVRPRYAPSGGQAHLLLGPAPHRTGASPAGIPWPKSPDFRCEIP
jgi:hypothetical protein